ncbi:SMI1/KNR4 family protein [Streptomyces albidoflavus]
MNDAVRPTEPAQDAFARLLVRMSPELGDDQEVGWQAVEAKGFRFPGDYKRFMAHFGAGMIEDTLAVLGPPVADDVEYGSMLSETRNACALWPPEAPGTAGVWPVERQLTERPPLIAWAVTTGGDLVCWLSKEDDPDRWPVAVWGRQEGPEHWTIVPHGMTGFLLGLFNAELDKHPLSDSSLWDKPNPRFISEKSEGRMRAEGIDPWTGEPDPLAGISFDD